MNRSYALLRENFPAESIIGPYSASRLHAVTSRSLTIPKLVVVSTGGVSLATLEGDDPAIIEAQIGEKHCAVSAVETDADFRRNGLRLTNNDAVVTAPGRTVLIVAHGHTIHHSLFVPPEQLLPDCQVIGGKDNCGYRCGIDQCPLLRGMRAFEVTDGSLVSLRRVAGELEKIARHHPEAIHEDKVKTSVEAAIRSAAARVVSSQPSMKSDLGHLDQVSLVSHARRIIRESRGESLTILDICRITGAPERTLRHAFQEVVGLPPYTFLRNERLCAARRDFLQLGKKAKTVEVALQHGFTSAHRFTVEYQKHFGETPRETMARAVHPGILPPDETLVD